MSRVEIPIPVLAAAALGGVLLVLAGVSGIGGQTSILLGPTPVPASLLHVVDGVTMMAEQPCGEDADCALFRHPAMAALGIAESSVAATHLAQTGPVAGGFWAERAVVFDLLGGQRRAVVIECGAFNAPPVTCRAVSQ